MYTRQMAATLILYTREGCHLCQEAARLAASVGAGVQRVDIGGDVGLLERYRFTIPVLRNPECEREISWPFRADEIAELLAPDPT